MQQNAERFANRFAPLFEKEGLVNVKFFMKKKKAGVSLSEFLEEAAAIQDTIAADQFTVVQSIDGETVRKPFDAAF